jgi:hypothetical protein
MIYMKNLSIVALRCAPVRIFKKAVPFFLSVAKQNLPFGNSFRDTVSYAALGIAKGSVLISSSLRKTLVHHYV